MLVLKPAVLCLGYGLALALITMAATQVLGIAAAIAVTLIGAYVAERLGEHLSRLAFRPHKPPSRWRATTPH